MKPKKSEVSSVATDGRIAPKLERGEDNQIKVVQRDEDEIRNLYGTKTNEAAEAIFKSALNAFGQRANEYFELMPAMAVEMEPRDAVEAMLVTQMTATHLAITTTSLKMHHADYLESRESFERSMSRLSRTFVAQMEALKKYRAKAQQVVRVERVEVKDGGQAVVGDVSYEGGGCGKK